MYFYIDLGPERIARAQKQGDVHAQREEGN